MNRRDFFNLSLPAAGAVLVAPALMNFTTFGEINNQFSGNPEFDEYDLIINGAGLSGYFAALEAVRKNLKVLIVEKRSSPGFDIAAKKRLWLNDVGFSKFDSELTELFLPQQEIKEINLPEGSGPNNSQVDNELLLFAGSIRKGMLRNLLIQKVHVLLMTEVCGLFTDQKSISGVLLACKHGLYAVKCKNFVDASDNLLFSRNITNQNYQFRKAGFVLELLNVKDPKKSTLKVSENLGLIGNQVSLHRGKNCSHQAFLEFELPCNDSDLGQVEIKARNISSQIGVKLAELGVSFEKATIHQLALECSVFINTETLPTPLANGHFLLASEQSSLSCSDIVGVKMNAENLVRSKIRSTKTRNDLKILNCVGAAIPIDQLLFAEPNEPGLQIPLRKCSFALAEHLPVKANCQVLVAGAGTAGSMAGIGSAQKGANTVVVDYFNDQGGTKTVGGVMGYYHCVKTNKLLVDQEREATMLADGLNMSKKAGRTIYLLTELLKAGGKYLPGTIICGSLVKNSKVEGLVVCADGKLELVKSNLVIDATGDGDVAEFSGASFVIGNSRTGITQDFSQWDISGGGKIPGSATRDYDFIDNTRIAELQRGLFLSHYEAYFYDFHPYLTVREARRVQGLYELNLADAVEGTHFNDVISLASSDFDPHYVPKSEFSRAGFLLPHSNDQVVEIPYQSIVPKGIDGLLISGRAISQSQNVLQFTRMSGDLLVLGYFTGQIGATIVKQNIDPKNFSISSLQQEWLNQGYLEAKTMKRRAGNLADSDSEIKVRVEKLAEGKSEYLYYCCLLPKSRVVKLLIQEYKRTESEPGKLLLAKALAWFGELLGNKLVENELVTLFDEEQKSGYPRGYVDNYDSIRGREKNVLEGLFWRINQDIALLAMAGDENCCETIRFILENTKSGGKMVERESEYFNGRIDLRIIPFYNRIVNLCFYAERVPDSTFISGLRKLLNDEYISGYLTESFEKTRWRVYGGDLELYIGSVLARCGSATGYHLLVDYLGDVHYNFKTFALRELQELTGQTLGYHPEEWRMLCKKLNYPRPTHALVTPTEL